MCKHHRVLVVDDNHEIVRATTLRLRAAGYDTRTASDGNAVVEAAVECHPDAIVMDVKMPGKDGLTALSELKRNKDTREIPVVMLSASIVDQQAALEAGARYFIRKPHSGRELVEALQSIVTI